MGAMRLACQAGSVRSVSGTTLLPSFRRKVFGDAIQDVLLVMYLSNVTKMQLMLAEKLQTASLLV